MEGKKQFMVDGGYQGPGKKKDGKMGDQYADESSGVCAHCVKTLTPHRSACQRTFPAQEALKNQTGKTLCLMDVNRPLPLVALVAVRWTLAMW